MKLDRQPYPPWRGLAASLVLHAGLLGGVGAWVVSSGDEVSAVATVELVSLPVEPVAAPQPALAAPSVSAPVVPGKSARPRQGSRPVAASVAAAVPIRREDAPPGEAEGGEPAPAAPAAAGAAGGEGEAVAASSGSQSGSPAMSEAVPMAGNPRPLYPLGARRAGREGRTVLLVSLSAAGECVAVSVAESSGTASLDESAVAAVKVWRFHPAARGNQPIPVTVRVPIQFSLNGGLTGLPIVGQR